LKAIRELGGFGKTVRSTKKKKNQVSGETSWVGYGFEGSGVPSLRRACKRSGEGIVKGEETRRKRKKRERQQKKQPYPGERPSANSNSKGGEKRREKEREKKSPAGKKWMPLSGKQNHPWEWGGKNRRCPTANASKKNFSQTKDGSKRRKNPKPYKRTEPEKRQKIEKGVQSPKISPAGRMVGKGQRKGFGWGGTGLRRKNAYRGRAKGPSPSGGERETFRKVGPRGGFLT